MKFRYAFKTFVCHEILEILVLMDADNQKTKITRGLYGEAPLRGPTPYPFKYHFFRKGTPFVYLLLGKGTPFIYLLKKTYE